MQEILTTAAKAVKANEPGTLRYHLQREVKGDAPIFILLETYILQLLPTLPEPWLTPNSYENQAAIEAHGKSEAFKTLGRTMKQEDLLAEPMKVLFTKAVGGYSSKL